MRNETKKQLLDVQKLHLKTPTGRSLLEDFDLSVEVGEVILIQGDNGSGKTTLLRSLLGLWPHYEGKIKSFLTKKQVSYVPQIQSPEIHMPLSLRDVLFLSSSSRADKGCFEEEVLSLGLLNKQQLSYNWNDASGGEKKRTLLTETLLRQPQLIFLDEPFNHLDQTSHDLMGECLKRFVLSQMGTLVLVTHEEKSAHFFKSLPVKRVKI